MSDYLCIGIDFGTTFSGAAWAFSRQPNNIKIITKWQADHAYNTDDAKTPTQLVYEEQNAANKNAPNGRTVSGWGYEVKPGEKPLKWFKLCLVDIACLEPELQESEQLIEAENQLRCLNISAVDAAADFLQQLWNHTLRSIERELGKATVESLPFRVVVTVPAIWPEHAMQRTQQAAKRAGILKTRACGETKLDLVPEPEAAALATLTEFKGRPGVRAGDVVTICDCGGGTVDITSYEIEESDSIVHVRESVSGDGKMCGGIFVDEQFQNVMQTRLGKRWEKLKPEQVKKVMNDEWEYGIKRLFQNDSRDWEVKLPAEATPSLTALNAARMLRRPKVIHPDLVPQEMKISKGVLKLSSKHVLAIFEPVVNNIMALVSKQIQEVIDKTGSPPKCVLLVGGFGRCSYLYQVLKEQYEKQGIELLQGSGDGPWTAISRGAVIKAMSDGQAGVKVTTRISRRNYGVKRRELFNPSLHLQIDRTYCPLRMEYQAKNQMIWYLRKGADIATQRPVTFDFCALYTSAEEIPNNKFSQVIWSSDTDAASNRKTEDVTELCHLTVHVDTPFNELPIFTNENSEKFRRIDYEIEMICSGTVLKFSVIVNGIRQPSRNITCSYEQGRINGGHSTRVASELPA